MLFGPPYGMVDAGAGLLAEVALQEGAHGVAASAGWAHADALIRHLAWWHSPHLARIFTLTGRWPGLAAGP